MGGDEDRFLSFLVCFIGHRGTRTDSCLSWYALLVLYISQFQHTHYYYFDVGINYRASTPPGRKKSCRHLKAVGEHSEMHGENTALP